MIPTVRTEDGRNTGAGCVTGIVKEFIELQENKRPAHTLVAKIRKIDFVLIMINAIRLSAYS